MRILVNARLLNKPFTGIGQVTRNLIKELAKIDNGNQYVLVVAEPVAKEIAREFPSNVEIKVLKERPWPGAGMRKTWWEQVQVPEFFSEMRAQVAWFTYPCNPWNLDWYENGIKTVVTVHDCIPWMNKKYRMGILSRLYHRQTRKAVGKADLVLTVSGQSMKDIEKVCGVAKSKIEVVYNDASEAYKEPVEKKFSEEVLGRFSLKEGEYFFYVGGYDLRKNVQYLVAEHERFCEESGHYYPLVLAGGKLFGNKLYGSFESLGRVIKTGFLPERELAVLYSGCLAFVHMSEQEGFNISVMEAANCGAPMILSDIPVHREVAEDSALFVKLERGELVKAFEKVMPENLRQDLKKKSRNLAKKYSWEKYAKIVKNLLDKI